MIYQININHPDYPDTPTPAKVEITSSNADDNGNDDGGGRSKNE